MECKFQRGNHILRFVNVLIETLWNVNIERMKNLETGEEQVLIETLWNVNIVTQLPSMVTDPY